VIKGDGYIEQTDKRHFNGRPYLHHICILAFTLSGLVSLEKSYIANPLQYSDALTKSDRDKLDNFLESVESAISIIKNMRDTDIKPLTTAEIKQHVFRYVNGFYDDEGLRDLQFSDHLQIGEKRGRIYAICDERYLPDHLKTHVIDTTIQDANSRLHMAMLEPLGIHLRCSHIINQIWQMDGNRYRNDLSNRVKEFGRYREFDKSIKHKYKGLDEYEQEITAEDNVLCRTHVNLILLDDNEDRLSKAGDQVQNILTNAGFHYYIPSYEMMYNIFVSSVIGREKIIDPSLLFLSDLHSSLCMTVNYTNFKSDREGILLNDRIFQIPLRKDIWDRKKKRIPARNFMIVASTGGGKSVTAETIVQQLIEAGFIVVVVEFGKSFYQLCQYYKDISLHVDYDGESPLGINPFLIEKGRAVSKEKIRTLVDIVLKYWRVPSHVGKQETEQIVSITKILSQYYKDVKTDHSFPSFYNYVKDQGKNLFDKLNIRQKFFDIESFLHVCSEFMDGGFYENVCKWSPLEEQIREARLICFELTKIKKDPFLISVIMSILIDTTESKLLSSRQTEGILLYDEYAESQAMKDMFSGTDIHSTVAFSFQKLRKENSAAGVIVQSPDQLPKNEYTDGIIANTNVLYVLPTNEKVYDAVIDTFHMKKPSFISLMKSIRNNFTGAHPHSELFMQFQDNYATVARLELSPEKLLVFQTDGEKWSAIQEIYKDLGSIPDAVEQYKKRKSQSYET